MFIFIIFLLILTIVTIIFSTCMWFTSIWNYALPVLILGFILYIIFEIMFFKFLKSFPKNDSSEFINFNIRSAIKNVNGKKIIEFIKQDGIWVCYLDNQIIKLNLKGLPIEKEYIRSFIIRNLRYKIISKKAPIYHLIDIKYPGIIKGDLFLKLVDTRETIIQISYNGITKHSLFSRWITKARFHQYCITSKSLDSFKKFITYIDETQYMKYK